MDLRRIFTSVAPAVITLVFGGIILITFIPGFPPQLVDIRARLVEIAVIVAGAALLLGFVRLMNLHLRRFQQKRNFYSLIALGFGLIVFVLLFAERFIHWMNKDQSVANLTFNNFVFNAILMPIESSLGALLAIFLAVAALRMAQRRRTWGTLWFLLSAVIVLITQIPASSDPWNILQIVRDFFNALAMGGLRGLLLGVALGTLAVAIRVLFAIDRPQGE